MALVDDATKWVVGWEVGYRPRTRSLRWRHCRWLWRPLTDVELSLERADHPPRSGDGLHRLSLAEGSRVVTYRVTRNSRTYAASDASTLQVRELKNWVF